MWLGVCVCVGKLLPLEAIGFRHGGCISTCADNGSGL